MERNAVIHLLAVAFRYRILRRLLVRLRWPQPDDLARMSATDLEAIFEATGFARRIELARQEMRERGAIDSRRAEPVVRPTEGSPDQPRSAPVA